MDLYTCPNGCDLHGAPIREDERKYYQDGTTHYSRLIGFDGGYEGIYDGVVAWQCPDCGILWPRKMFENDPRVIALVTKGV